MRANKPILPACALALVLAVAACGDREAEREARERARLEAEENARRAEAAGNKAITDMNQKLGRKPPVLDLGVPAKTESATKKP